MVTKGSGDVVSTKHGVFPCRVAAAGDGGQLVCTAVADPSFSTGKYFVQVL